MHSFRENPLKSYMVLSPMIAPEMAEKSYRISEDNRKAFRRVQAYNKLKDPKLINPNAKKDLRDAKI